MPTKVSMKPEIHSPITSLAAKQTLDQFDQNSCVLLAEPCEIQPSLGCLACLPTLEIENGLKVFPHAAAAIVLSPRATPSLASM